MCIIKRETGNKNVRRRKIEQIGEIGARCDGAHF